MTDYAYSKMNFIENPQKYQMTPFEGKKFLNDYFKFRQDIINQIKPIELSSLEQLINSMLQSKSVNMTKNISIEYELLIILSDIINDNYSFPNNTIAEKFIKKFEISKKLYDEYSKDFSSYFGTNSNYKNYLLLSLVCILYYSKFNNLKFLNTALKINDSLCSVINLIFHDIDKSLFFHSLEMEKKLITDLINSKDLKI